MARLFSADQLIFNFRLLDYVKYPSVEALLGITSSEKYPNIYHHRLTYFEHQSFVLYKNISKVGYNSVT